MKYSVVIVAAGSGTRMNLGYNKVFYPINDNETVLSKTVACFDKHKECNEIIIVTQKENFDLCKIKTRIRLKRCVGGATRSESVINGLNLVEEDYVMIHDGARPFINIELLDKLVKTLENNDACLLAVPCKDTIKVVKKNVVKSTPDRATLYHAQTPQAFKTAVLKRSYEKIRDITLLTDDASCVELANECDVVIVEGSYSNTKITTMEDLELLKNE